MQYGNHSLEQMLSQLPQEEQSTYRRWLNQVLREVIQTRLTPGSRKYCIFTTTAG